MFELEQEKERILLVGVSVDDGDDTEESLDELAGACADCGSRDSGKSDSEIGSRFTREPTWGKGN